MSLYPKKYNEYEYNNTIIRRHYPFGLQDMQDNTIIVEVIVVKEYLI
jgi:hypothetical protein